MTDLPCRSNAWDLEPDGVQQPRYYARIDRQARNLYGTQYRAVNSALVQLYWHVDDRIRRDVLKEKRAEYGKEILSTLSKELTADYGNGYSVPNLWRMLRLAEVFPDQQILSALSAKLAWSHFVEIIPLKEQLKRDFYAEMRRRTLERSHPAEEDRWD